MLDTGLGALVLPVLLFLVFDILAPSSRWQHLFTARN